MAERDDVTADLCPQACRRVQWGGIIRARGLDIPSGPAPCHRAFSVHSLCFLRAASSPSPPLCLALPLFSLLFDGEDRSVRAEARDHQAVPERQHLIDPPSDLVPVVDH